MANKRIDGFPQYRITTDGNVISSNYRGHGKEGVLKPSSISRGYRGVMLYNKDDAKRKNIHRLIAEAFIPNPENKPCVNHINGDKQDNRVENLEWCTHSENNKHAYDTGLKSTGTGSNHHNAKGVICLDTGKEYGALREAARELDLSEGHISKVCRGQRKTTGGLKFKYKEVA